MGNFTTFFRGTAFLAIGCVCLGASASVNFIADPDPATMVSELSSVTLTFPEASEVDMGSQYQKVTVTSEDFSINCTLDFGVDLNPNQIVVTFSKISEEGTYTVNVPEDAITADGKAVEAFSITYNVGVETMDNSTLIPAPGEVDWLYEFIYFNPDVTANLNVESYGDAQPTVISPSGEVSELISVYDYMIDPGKYTFRLRKLAFEPGKYTISFPEEYIYYYDESYTKIYLPACEFTYEVKGAELTQVISDPSMTEPTFNFNYLNLEFPGYSTIAIKDDMSYSQKSISVYMDGKEESVASITLEEGEYYFTIEGNKMSWTNQYSDLTTPGDYFLTIPEGSVLLGEDKTPCTPFIVNLKVVAPAPAVIDIEPANGSTVSMLNKAVITFPQIGKVDLGRNPSIILEKVTIENDEEKFVTVGGAYSPASYTRLTDNSFLAEFSGLATVDGNYRITVTSNSFVYDGGYNQEYSVDVKFVAPAAPVFSMTPDNSEALPKLQKFTITFPAENVVKLNESLNSNSSVLYKGDEIVYNDWGMVSNQQIGSASYYTEVEGSSNSFSFTLSSAALDEGKYVLYIPAGVFLMGEDADNFNGEIIMVYECNGEGLDKVVVTPDVPVKELQDISVTYINESSISLYNEYTWFTFYKYLEGETYAEYVEFISSENVKVEGNTLYITLANPITEEGIYYLEITAYSLLMSDGETVSTPQNIFFTVDPDAADPVAVETVVTTPADTRIFTITGMEVKEMTSPGIYVVNGKKVIVK